MKKQRNTKSLVRHAGINYQTAIEAGMMQVNLKTRNGKTVTLEDGRKVTEFVNCSYLGLDSHPEVVRASQEVQEDWGVHFCCARSRFTIGPNQQLEAELSEHFGGRAITFPSVTSAHMAAMPLLASGVLLEEDGPVRLIFDRFAHASMQFLRPILAEEAQVVKIGHNDMEALREQIVEARAQGEIPVYVADSVYSMGGACPMGELAKMNEELDFYMYLDDAHGTSLFGDKGQGYVIQEFGYLPENVIFTYSLAKGFGCNGGGIVLPTRHQESMVRTYGVPYAFSAPLDFSIVGAALAALKLHRNGTVRRLQQDLWHNLGVYTKDPDAPRNPIQMVQVGRAEDAIKAGQDLVDLGFFASVVFFPIVPKDQAQLRVCVSATHTEEQINGLRRALRTLGLLGYGAPERPQATTQRPVLQVVKSAAV